MSWVWPYKAKKKKKKMEGKLWNETTSPFLYIKIGAKYKTALKIIQ